MQDTSIKDGQTSHWHTIAAILQDGSDEERAILHRTARLRVANQYSYNIGELRFGDYDRHGVKKVQQTQQQSSPQM